MTFMNDIEPLIVKNIIALIRQHKPEYFICTLMTVD